MNAAIVFALGVLVATALVLLPVRRRDRDAGVRRGRPPRRATGDREPLEVDP